MNINKTLILIILFQIIIISSFDIYGQPDCIIGYRYVGSIQSDSIVIDSIELPTTIFMVGWKNMERNEMFSKHNIAKNKINCKFYSHMGWYFCYETEIMLKNVFKKEGLDFYPIKLHIRGLNKTIIIKIPIENIEFNSISDDELLKLEIDFGEIKI